MISLIRIILAALMLAPVFNPAVGEALYAPATGGVVSCCCRGGMAGMDAPALPSQCPGRASCALMREPPAGLAAFLPSSPYRLSLDLCSGHWTAMDPALGVGVVAADYSHAKPPPGPLFLLNHALLI